MSLYDMYFSKKNDNTEWTWPLVAFRDKVFYEKYIEHLEIISDKNKMLSTQNNVEDLANKIMYFVNNRFKLELSRNFDIKNTMKSNKFF